MPVVTSTRSDLDPAPGHNGLVIGLSVAAVVVAIDQVVKSFVERTLGLGEFVPWLSDSIGWQLVYNDGGAFGFSAPSWFFLVVTVIVLVVVIRNLPSVHRVMPAICYGLLLAGALGNAIDRVFRLGDAGDPRYLHGHVVDFVAWGSFPRFNVADAAITIGFAMLFLDLLRDSDDHTQEPAGDERWPAGADRSDSSDSSDRSGR